MSDSLDLINTVRLHDNAISGQNRDLQYDLDRRADRIARKTGVTPLDWDEFNSQSAPRQEESKLNHAGKWGMGGVVTGLVLGVALVGIQLAFAYFTAPILMGQALTMLASAGGIGGALGGVAGAALSLIDDQKPEIRAEQLAKYKTYLDGFEASASRSTSPEQTTDIEKPNSKQWQLQAQNPKQAANKLGRA